MLQRRILGHCHLAAAVYQHAERLGAGAGIATGPPFITTGNGHQFDLAGTATLPRQPQPGLGARRGAQAVLHTARTVCTVYRGVEQPADAGGTDIRRVKATGLIQCHAGTDLSLGRRTRAVVFEAEYAADSQIQTGLGTITIRVRHCLYQGQYATVQRQADTVIMIAGITMPDIVQQIQGYRASGRIDRQGEVVHPVGTAGNDITDLVEHNLSALTIGNLRIDSIETACHIVAIKHQVVTNAARPIRPEGMVELGLHHGGCQRNARNTVTVGAAQLWQTLIHTEHPQFTGTRDERHTRYVIEYHHIQTGAGAVAITVRQHDIETFGQRCVIGGLGMRLVIAKGVAVGDAADSSHGVVTDAGHQQLIAQRTGDRLRETGDDQAVADERHTTQRQALDPVCRIEGKGAAFGQCCGIRGAPIGQSGFTQNELTPFNL